MLLNHGIIWHLACKIWVGKFGGRGAVAINTTSLPLYKIPSLHAAPSPCSYIHGAKPYTFSPPDWIQIGSYPASPLDQPGARPCPLPPMQLDQGWVNPTPSGHLDGTPQRPSWAPDWDHQPICVADRPATAHLAHKGKRLSTADIV